MSRKRSDASRINGTKSKGPTSPEGKDKVRLNARTLGLYSSDVVIPKLGESSEEYAACREGFLQAVIPENALEEALFEDIVENWWRRRRVRRCESKAIRQVNAGIVDSMLSSLNKPTRPGFDELDDLMSDSGDGQHEKGVLAISAKMSHAETRYDRRFYKAVVTLYMIKGLNAKLALAADSLPQLPDRNKGSEGVLKR